MKSNVFHLLKERWLLLLVLAGFVVAKVLLIDCPFYWDESWSYEPGVRLMYQHGPSLMPGAIDLFYSRGHPLLFYAAAATWMRIFGPGNIAQHAFSLSVAVLLIIASFEITRRVFNIRAANFAALLLPLQVMFFVQSTMVLPEVMVALLALCTLWSYSNKRHLLTFLSCTALMLTKESGMVLGLLLGLHSFFALFSRKDFPAEKLKTFAAMLVSGICIGLFFLAQKKTYGWYLFPEHMHMVRFVWQEFYDKWWWCIDELFCLQNRVILFQMLLVLSAAVDFKRRDWRYLVPVVVAIVIFEAFSLWVPWFPRRILLVLMIALFAGNIFLFVSTFMPEKNKISQRFIYLGAASIITYLLFSCLNFLTIRYTIAPLVILLIFTAGYIEMLVGHLGRQVLWPVAAVILLNGYFAFRDNKGLGDIELGSYAAMQVEGDIVTFLEQSNLFKAAIAAGSFDHREHLTKPLTGFLHGANSFSRVGYDITQTTNYVIFDNIDPDQRYISIKSDTANFYLAYRTEKGPAWGEIYARKQAK